MDFEHEMLRPEWSKPATARGGAAERASPFDGCAVIVDSTLWRFPAKPRRASPFNVGSELPSFCYPSALPDNP